ncbi:ankyrin repeat domain-containing protein EMB506, chloroplastic [Dioscorea cayenensis subsp. rotundata]|uniref:Ankyrin repeat domain-containing protein EMB506, chloroplastic n=1 Tax=Dioscorea cayennensis subsp. rotundata TaxID=55577 RepID=A0AB40BWR4_DIOCR|nr:ankyrin repeat domain-containing protein EMB506, chloroplastic [Dioscorea cayenensis subsp. rotundata]
MILDSYLIEANAMLALSPSRALLHPSLSAAAHAALRRSISLGDSSHRLRFKSLRAPTALRRISNSSSPAKSASRGHWDESDDGHGSEYDEVDEEQEDYGIGSTATAEEYEKLVEEVELLLGEEEKAILQLNEAPDLSKLTSRKWSLFHSLALSSQIRFIDELLQYGIFIDLVDKDGYTALHKAVIGRKEAVITHLLRKGANPHVKDRDGATPLHSAVQVGAMKSVKLLIKYKADVNVADNEGWTPLHLAIQSRSREIAKVLLVNGADATRRNKDGKTPLDLSLCFGKDFKSYELAKLLKLFPANRNLETQ